MNQNDSFKKSFEEIEIPKELDLVIVDAMNKGKRKKKIQKLLKPIATGIAACFILLAININTLPAFAEYLKQIPILSNLIGFIQLDKGLNGASKEDMLQKIQKSAQDQDIQFEIDNIITDGKNITISYGFDDLKNNDSHDLFLLDYSITDEKGNVLLHMELNGEEDKVIDKDSAKLIPNGPTASCGNAVMRRFKWTPENEKIPEKMIFNCSKIGKYIPEENKSVKDWRILEFSGKWSVPFAFHIPKNIAPKIYKDIKVTAQEETFLISIEIYPTMAEATVTSENPIHERLNFFLIDEEGNIFSPTFTIQETDSLWINAYESPYYTDSKNLYLVAKRSESIEESKLIEKSLDRLDESLKIMGKAYSRKTVSALDENNNWIIKNGDGKIIWKEPVHLETIFKVKLK